jgi:hypothetical protein
MAIGPASYRPSHLIRLNSEDPDREIRKIAFDREHLAETAGLVGELFRSAVATK